MHERAAMSRNMEPAKYAVITRTHEIIETWNSLDSESHFKWPPRGNGFQITTWDIKSKGINRTVNKF